MLTCHLQQDVKATTECRFQIQQLFVKIKYLPLLSTVNLPLVEFIHILTNSNSYKLRNELVCLKEIFRKNGYSEDFINKCFKKFMYNIYLVKETTVKVLKQPLVLVLPYLGSISLQTRTKLKESLKTFLLVASCKHCLRIRLDQATTFISRIRFPKILLLVSFINFSVDSAMSPIMVNV